MAYKSKRKWISFVAAVLLVCLYVIIFSFSAQDGTQSGGLSYSISEKCVELFQDFSGKSYSELILKDMAKYFEHPLRKMAHFTEYACMGLLVYVMLAPWRQKGIVLYGIVTVWVLLSAVGDEVHQLFVPGRYGSVSDVLLDTCGGVFGMICCIILEKCIRRLT